MPQAVYQLFEIVSENSHVCDYIFWQRDISIIIVFFLFRLSKGSVTHNRQKTTVLMEGRSIRQCSSR